MKKTVKAMFKYGVTSGVFFTMAMFCFDLLDAQVQEYRVEKYGLFFLCMAASGAVGKWYQLRK